MRCFLGCVVVAGLLVGCEAQPVPIAPPPVVQSGVPSGGSTTTEDTTGFTGTTTGEGSSPVAPAAASTEAASATNETTTLVPTPLAPAGTAPGAATSEVGAPAAEATAANADKIGTPVALSGGVAVLTPENTKIQFVGTHSPPKQPDPRTGGFAKFEGKAQVDPAAKKLLAVNVDIQTASLFTGIDKLTTHLKSGDFFEVREHPTAKFESSKITTEEGGKATITGSLTLHGVTKEISFPATVQISDEGLALKSEFSIDRTEFGMTFKGVENKVDMTVVIGEKTVPK